MYPKVQFHPAHTHARNLPSTASNFTPAQCGPVCGADAAQRPLAVAEAIKWVAQRIRKCPEGQFPASPPPQVLSQLTDELLVTASDVIRSVAAEDPPLNGNSTLRLLAWTVADARGATVVLEKPLALTVGKRLDRQAQFVRAKLEEIRERAQEERGRLDSGDFHDRVYLNQVDQDEAKALRRVREEEYIGFHELDALLPEAADELCTCPAAPASPRGQPPSALPPSTPESVRTPAVAESPHTAWDRELRAIGCYFPWQLVENFKEEMQSDYFAVPPDLANAIGPEATKALRAHRAANPCKGMQWWQFGLPSFVKHLLEERLQHDEDMAEIQQYLGRVDSHLEMSDHELQAVAAENEALHKQLRESRRREKDLDRALRDALR